MYGVDVAISRATVRSILQLAQARAVHTRDTYSFILNLYSSSPVATASYSDRRTTYLTTDSTYLQ